MCNKRGCQCEENFDAEIAFKRLSEKYNDLAEIVANYLSEADIADRSIRAKSAQRMAELLIRIVGGSRVAEGEYPECCLVGTKNVNGTSDWFCTGILVHPRIVLTAAHCFQPGSSYVVALNTVNQNGLSKAEIIDVKKAVQHAGYQQTGKFNDISVLVLSRTAATVPIQIASSDEINTALNTTLVGFGNDDVNSTVGFGIKRVVSVPINSIRRAIHDNLDADENYYDYESDLEFVAGGNGYDSCNGDSGGPAYIVVDGVRKLAGLTSRSTARANTRCGDGGIYTRVDAHLNFISALTPIS
ncbi:S1 family peptidase [Dyadobacter fanqingshengii]|uniref:Serine protease n=1 Tax=Dyadobacter fanqingshengii TaxID=2906443 RepID=A0A9X1P8U4_9BACT|nr:serine protease [Dyadobacter fanqingshengii]MCF0039794.1 serine protease [Dyadobacter fanqingshengii]USJ38443.1 serine protease [Dyadobacter fanqingshengii]